MNNEQKRKYEILLKLIGNETNSETRAILISQALDVLRDKND